MDDLISKQAFKEECLAIGFFPAMISAALNRTPVVDAVPVVRCKDCKHTDTDGCETPAIYCKKWDRWEMPEDFFCSYGERKENG
jgi:hypothetical protein